MTQILHNDRNALFCEGRLDEWLHARLAAATERAAQVPEARLLATPLDDLADEIAAPARVAALEVDDTPSVDMTETTADARHLPDRHVFDRSRPVPVPATGINVHLGFRGDPALLGLRPSVWSSNPPHAQVSGREIVVHGLYAGALTPGDAALLGQVRRWIDEHVRNVREHAERQRAQVEAHNASVVVAARRALEARRERALARQGVQGGLGYPLRTRPDAPMTVAPDGVRRTRIVPQAPSGAGAPNGSSAAPAFVPEPALSVGQYRDVLAVLRAMGRSMERTPRAFEPLGEEDLRSILLAALNAVFEGAATAETFSFLGKTDLLVRHQGANVFVGECKVWSGPKSLTDALDQILDYVTWRDTKTAVVMFVPRAEMGETLAAMAAAADAHPHAKRRVGGVDGDGQWAFRHKTDSSRELTVAILAFHLPRAESRTGKRRGRRDAPAAQS